MGQDPGQVGAQQLDDSQKSAEQLRVEIEETREDLGDTVEALAAKTDIKTRARERADELKRAAQQKKQDLLAKAGRSSTEGEAAVPTANGAGSASRRPTVAQMRGAVRENPVPTAALAGFIGGVAFGRLISRP